MKLFNLAAIFLIAMMMIFIPKTVEALPFTNFGGQIVGMLPCACSANWILYVRDVRYQMLPLIYQPGITFLYKMYQPRPAVNSLGSFVPGGVCLIYVGTGCSPVPVVGTMLQLGTSLSIGK